MAEFLLELLSEEIPARMQQKAAAELARLIESACAEARLPVSDMRHYATPRRLTVVAEMAAETGDLREERKGPSVDAPAKAIEGFLRATGLERDQVAERETPKGKALFAVIETPGRPAAEALPPLIEGALAALPWPKSMRWGAHKARWVRPLHMMICLLDGAVLPVRYGTVTAANLTRGHPVHAPSAFAVENFADYQAGLVAAQVVLDVGERKRIIAEGAAALTEAAGLTLIEDPALLDEVAGLVEWPTPLLGRIDEAFMDLPPEVLTLSMKTHQKYFATGDAEGRLAPRFITVANLQAEDGGEAIIAGNEKVLRARLSDARFFWDQDRKRRLESRIDDLEALTFLSGLGSMAARSGRLTALAARIVAYYGNTTLSIIVRAPLAARAAALCKCDLTTGMVWEFPELQGLMGGYYARHDGEREEVAQAIADHYAPAGPDDRCPTAPVSVALALADRIDMLAGFFAIGETPTGSRDPYGLRRAALGVIRLIVENECRLPLGAIFEFAFRQYDWVVDAETGRWRGDEAGGAPPSKQTLAPKSDATVTALLDFITDRLKAALRRSGVRHDHVNAVFTLGWENDLPRLKRRAGALRDWLDTDRGKALLSAYRRAANILRIEEKKDGVAYPGPADPKLFQAAEEKALVKALEVAKAQAAAVQAAEEKERVAEEKALEAAKAQAAAVQAAEEKALETAAAQATEEKAKATAQVAAREFAAMTAMAALHEPVDGFFEHVTVNADDPALRQNRLKLLADIRDVMHRVADFSKIEG